MLLDIGSANGGNPDARGKRSGLMLAIKDVGTVFNLGPRDDLLLLSY